MKTFKAAFAGRFFYGLIFASQKGNMRYFLLLILFLFSTSCSDAEIKEEKVLTEINWEKELLGYGSLHLEGEYHTHLFYYFGDESKNIFLKGDTLFLSFDQLKNFLNYYSRLPGSKDSLIRRPLPWYLSNESYAFKLEKNEDLVSLYNIHKSSDVPLEMTLQMYSSNIPKDLSLLHLENIKEKEVKFHWEAPKKVYINYEKVFMEDEDFETFRKQNVQKTYLNQCDEKILFSYLNLFNTHYNNPFHLIESGCGPRDYENVYTVVYNDSIYKYGMHTFPIPFFELMQGLTADLDPTKDTLDLDSDDKGISEKYKHLPHARERSKREVSNIDFLRELQFIDTIKPL